MRWAWLGLVAWHGVGGCSSVDEETVPQGLPGPEEWNRSVVPPSDEEAEEGRASCSYAAGALPAETQGESHPMGADIPIDNIVIVMMENRSFDHYFQTLPEYGQPDVDVAPAGFSNPDSDGVDVPIFKSSTYCFVDTGHGYNASHEQVGDGEMLGFVTSNDGVHEMPAGATLEMLSGSRAMGYYDETDIPFYLWLASEFSLGDRYFASVRGPTWPNRMYLMGASSHGRASNVLVDADETLMTYLDKRQIPWKMYYSTTPSYAMFLNRYLDVQENTPEKIVHIEQYFQDAQNGTLPPVAFVEPGIARESADADDEHPPAVMQVGQQFVANVVDALTKSPQWARSALFLTYDEHGGLYDHVAPPDACPPDDQVIALDDGTVPSFDHLGIRVPFIVVSPFARKHHVSHRVYDHTSIVRFVSARFVLPALSGRDANAEAPWDMFDFEDPPHLDPPAITIPTVDEDRLAECVAIFD